MSGNWVALYNRLGVILGEYSFPLSDRSASTIRVRSVVYMLSAG